MSKFRQLRNDPFQSVMSRGTTAAAMSSPVSHILTPMRNTDIRRLEKSGNWSELLEKAAAQTRRFRRDFYK